MIQTADHLSQLLTTMGYGESVVDSLPIPDCGEPAWAIAIRAHEGLALWSDLRSRVGQTQRWPVLSVCWGQDGEDWPRAIRMENFFNRQPFRWEQAAPDRDVSPRAIAERSVTAAIAPLVEQHNAHYTQDLAATWQHSLEQTRHRVGQAPSIPNLDQFLAAQGLQGYLDFERWLLAWELEHGEAGAEFSGDSRYLDWFDPHGQRQVLLLLPTPNAWEVLAFIHWYGAETTGSEAAIAMVRHWHETHGAELVAHYGTMLQFDVKTPPLDLAAAFHLAAEQEALAPCTTALPGVSLRDHARCLKQARRWFLHERP